MLGVVLSSTDELAALTLIQEDLTPRLYSILFGEGVFNDSLAILLFEPLQDFDIDKVDMKYILTFIGHFLLDTASSLCLGLAIGLLSAVIVKNSESFRKDTAIQTSMMLYLAYLSYLLATVLEISAIITLLACAITMGHYTWYNLSPNAQKISKTSIKVMSESAEAFAFTYMGLSVWGINEQSFSWSLVLGMIFIVLFSRLVSVFLLSGIYNLRGGGGVLRFNQLGVIWLGGAVRGAIVYGLVTGVNCEHKNLMILTSVMVVYVTTILIGAFLPTWINLMNPTENISIVGRLFRATQIGSQIPAVTSEQLPRSWVHNKWRYIDDTYIKPFLIYGYSERKNQTDMEKGIQ